MYNQYSNSCCNNSCDATNRSQNHFIFGLLIIVVGLMMLAKKMGFLFLHVHFMPVFFILIGIYSGIKHRFHNFWSWALITLGILLMIPKFLFFGILSTQLVGPIILILIGTFLLYKSYRFNNISRKSNDAVFQETISDDSFRIVSSFGEEEKVITSKKFEGGYLDLNFSDATINLLDADFEQPAVIQINATCSELNLILPDNWKVITQTENNFSSVTDKRWLAVGETDPVKNIIIKGKLNFSEIKLRGK